MQNTLFQTKLLEMTSRKGINVLDEIKDQPNEYFIGGSSADFEEYLISKYQIINIPIIHWKETEMDISTILVNGYDFPSTYDIIDGTVKYERQLIKYYVPFDLDGQLLYFKATRVMHSSGLIGYPYIENNQIIFSFIDFRESPELIEKDFDNAKRYFIQRFNSLKEEIESFNKELPKFIQNEITKRIKGIERFQEYKSKFSFPIRKDPNIPEIFRPKKVFKKEKITPKPVIDKTSGKETEERFITKEDYISILGMLNDCGKMWEHHSESYSGLGEDSLRDQLMFVLAPNINGVVAGEAYNKKGKTDISIKHGTTNLFIGECKIWGGPKHLTKTIDQILKYLTWRDSKAAIMNFVGRNDITKVIEIGQEAIESHPNFVRKVQEYNKGWTNYRFNLPEDQGVIIEIAFQYYHMPEL